MTIRELAESLNLKITANDVVYFDTYEASSDFQHKANEAGIKVEIHQYPDRGKTTCAVTEVRKESDEHIRSTGE